MMRRVVITGLGVIAPNGIGKEAFWQANIQGCSGIVPISRFDARPFPTRIAGEVRDFDPLRLGLTEDEIVTLDRGSQFALAAANLALEDAALPPLNDAEREAVGVIMGHAMAGADEGERMWTRYSGHNQYLDNVPDMADLPVWNTSSARSLMAFVPSSVIAAHHQFYGPCLSISTGCSAGADAIGQAFWAIQEGQAGRMLAGGADSAISPASINIFSVMHALSRRNDEPTRASRPYDAQRDGFVMSEGAAVLLLEDCELALARHARIYAELLTFTSNCNAYHMTALPENGAPLQALLRQTLQEGGIEPHQLGYINSHGSSTLLNEIAETAAYKAALGESAYRIPISATKSMIGHTQGAASAIEAAVTALALYYQVLPPTINQEQTDTRCDLDYVPNVARAANIELALTHSSGFGGVNTALLLRRWRS
jgi:3-oxoacyl-(acyl-carrier-protein) synthase